MIIIRNHDYDNNAYLSSNKLESLTPTFVRNKMHRQDTFYYIEIDRKLVVRCEATDEIADDSIAIHYLHADFLDLLYGHDVSVSSFTPPPRFQLKMLGLEIEDTGGKLITVKQKVITSKFMHEFEWHVFTRNQLLFFTYEDTILHMTVIVVRSEGNDARGQLVDHETELYFAPSDKFKIIGQNEVKKEVLRRDINLDELDSEMKMLGVGGLGKQVKDVLSQILIPHYLPQDIAREVRVKYQKGLILHGPPGTGKTLVARTIAKILNAKLKIVRGHELLDSYVGSSERHMRDIFQPAIEDYQAKGEDSPLHVIVFDELDALAGERGKERSSGVSDRVNLLLTMIDGYSGINNILLVGTTNRLDLIDEALRRPGRLELHLQIGLPDISGRMDILRINWKRLQRRGSMHENVELRSIAEETEGFSGADLEGLMQAAHFYAMTCCAQPDILKTNWENIQVTIEDIDKAIDEIKQTRGALQ